MQAWHSAQHEVCPLPQLCPVYLQARPARCCPRLPG